MGVSAFAGGSYETADRDPELARDGIGTWSGREALKRSLDLLEQGATRLAAESGYTATFYRQERVGSNLRDPEVVEMKLRHEPFSVYMRWVQGEPGQEVLFVKGRNGGDLILHPGGWKSRLLPAVKLDPHGALARSKSRYPIYEVGLLALAEKIAEFRREDLARTELPTARLEDGHNFQGRECYFFVVEYPRREMSPDYRKTLLYIDKQFGLPISICNFNWSSSPNETSSDEDTLIEHYVYRDLRLGTDFSELDFSPENDAYAFRR